MTWRKSIGDISFQLKCIWGILFLFFLVVLFVEDRSVRVSEAVREHIRYDYIEINNQMNAIRNDLIQSRLEYHELKNSHAELSTIVTKHVNRAHVYAGRD